LHLVGQSPPKDPTLRQLFAKAPRNKNAHPLSAAGAPKCVGFEDSLEQLSPWGKWAIDAAWCRATLSPVSDKMAATSG